MKLLLMRHGVALSKRADARRPLSDKGRAEVHRIADFLEKAGVHVPLVEHSRKTRAAETAELLAKRVSNGRTRAVAGITPNDPIEPFVSRMQHQDSDVMVVGHLPFLSHVLAELLVESECQLNISFVEACVVSLERFGRQWYLKWVVNPMIVAPEPPSFSELVLNG